MSRPSSISPPMAIAGRDLLEFVRDRRTVFITFLLPLFAYPIVALATALGLRSAVEQLDADRQPMPLAVTLSGPDAAAIGRQLVELRDDPSRGTLDRAENWPSALEVTLASVPEQALAALAAGQSDIWVDVPAGSAARLRGLGEVRLSVRGTGAEVDPTSAFERLQAVVASLSDVIRRERLDRLGVPQAVVMPFSLVMDAEPPAGGPSQAGSVFPTIAGSLLVILTLLTVTGAFHPAADAFAGEKERGTIETLLVAPCGIGEVVWGKFLAVFGVTLATLLANLVAIALTAAVGVRALPPDLLQLFTAVPSAEAVLAAVLTQVALSAVAASACLAITSALQSLKEAHHALTTVMLAVSVLAAAGIVPVPLTPWVLALIPVTGQVFVARLALTGDPVGLLLPLAIISGIAWTWLLLRASAAALSDEEVIFRGPDTAAGLFQRPAARLLPSPLQGILPAVAGLAATWYVQAFLPENLVLALPLQQLVSMALPLAVAAFWQRVDLLRTLRLRVPRGRGWLAVVGAAVLGVGLFLVNALVIRWLVGESTSETARELAARLTMLLETTPWWLVLLVLAVIPAVCEELVFRGWMLSSLVGSRQPSQGRVAVAVVVQAALFAAVHLLPERLPTTFGMGLVLGWIALVTGSLLPGIVCHVVHNAVPVGVTRLAGTPLESLEIPPAWLLAGSIVAVVIGASLVMLGGSRRSA
jgi:sodium transport system permease protein